MAHKDLSDDLREFFELQADVMARHASTEGQSLALAREAWINAFDKAASELEATDAE